MKVNEMSHTVAEMQEDILLASTLLGGTRAMRKMAPTYMPKRTMEEPLDYAARVAVSTLHPAYKETISKMTGRVFQSPLEIGPDVPTWIGGADDAGTDDDTQCICDDFDQQGRSIHVWSRDVFRAGLAYGMTLALVDSPPAVGANGQPIVTLADQKANTQVRPYAIHISIKRLIGFMQDGNGKLIQLRITGQRKEQGEFGETIHEQIWVYNNAGTITTLTFYEKDKDGNWAQYGTARTLGIDHIPLSVFYTNRTGFMEACPPLIELAHLNVKHYNKQSDHDELLKVASVPILVEYGGGESSTIVIGARSAVKMGAKPNSSLEFCEHSGKAIDAGSADLKDLEHQMRDAGAKLLQPTSGKATQSSKTATQVGEEAAADNSILGAMVVDYEDFMAAVLDDVAAWRSEGDGGTVKMQPNLDPDLSPIDSMRLLLDLANSGRYSDESLYEEAQKRGLINAERPWKEEMDRIKSQPESQLPPPTKPPGTPGGLPTDPTKQPPVADPTKP
jgi:hypothetical protein